jgi:predicted nucleotidyltransferase
MARGQRRTYLTGETVRQKKYFYAVRPLLACRYLLAERSLVPMRFFDLMDAVAPPAEVRDSLVEMLRTKRQASEAAEAQRLPVLDRWIEQSLDAVLPLRPRRLRISRWRQPSCRADTRPRRRRPGRS